MKGPPAVERLLARLVQGEGGCWLWTGYRDRDGYGKMADDHRNVKRAHRIAFQSFIGPIPEGCDVDHECWNRACCNPLHLRALPAGVNRGLQRRSLSPSCMHGHALSGANLYVNPRGQRSCRRCNATSVRKYKINRKERRAAP